MNEPYFIGKNNNIEIIIIIIYLININICISSLNKTKLI